MSKEKLPHIRSHWHRLIITICIACLVFIAQHASPRARVHWLGRNHRPRRPERLLAALLLFGAIFFLEAEEYVLWATLWGGALAIFINLHTLYVLIPRKQHHWVK